MAGGVKTKGEKNNKCVSESDSEEPAWSVFKKIEIGCKSVAWIIIIFSATFHLYRLFQYGKFLFYFFLLSVFSALSMQIIITRYFPFKVKGETRTQFYSCMQTLTDLHTIRQMVKILLPKCGARLDFGPWLWSYILYTLYS